MAVDSLRRLAARVDQWRWPILALALGLAVGLLVHAGFGLTGAVSLGVKPAILSWMLLGLVAGLYAQVSAATAAAPSVAAAVQRNSRAPAAG